jgi:hypothetical protein
VCEVLGGSVLQQRVPEIRLEVSPSVLQVCEELNGLLGYLLLAKKLLELFGVIDQGLRPGVFKE